MVVITKPATMSCRSQDDSYRRSISNPGTQRIQPVRVCDSTGRMMGSATWGERLLLMTFANNAQRKPSIHLATEREAPFAFLFWFKPLTSLALVGSLKSGDKFKR